MPPRFMERIHRENEILQTVFAQARRDPPPYPSSRSSQSTSDSSTSQSSSPWRRPPPLYMQFIEQRTSLDQRAIPKDSLILVTGPNSFQGSHIVDQLLENGYRVRGTVRDREKASWTSKYFTDKYSAERYTYTIIPDMAAKGAFDIAIRGCSGIIHVASVTSMSPDPNRVVTESIAGAVNALEAAASEPSVTRFVLTSSVAAAISHDRGKRCEVDSTTWNMMDFDEAWAPPPYDEARILAVAGTSKMQTEATVWRWCERNRPHFVINCVLPDTLWGTVLDPKNQIYPVSVAVLKTVFDGSPIEYPPSNFVDVQDSALLHVAALILPDVQDRRIFAVSTSWNMSSLTQLVQGLYPHREIKDDMTDRGVDQTLFTEASKAKELLGRMGRTDWTDIGKSVERTCKAFS